MAHKVDIHLTLNGAPRSASVHPMARLLDVVREGLGCTGVKEGCGEGECGACSVMLDGKLVNSCLIPAIQADGAQVTTIEGVASGARLHAVQEAFLSCGGAQCGICTPGMVLAAVDLLERKKGGALDEPAIREGLAGNLCRCTGYTKIFDAVVEACRRTGGKAECAAATSAASASGGAA